MIGDDRSGELKQAYAELQDAIRKVATLEDFDGLLTDWIVVAASQTFDDQGRAGSSMGWFSDYEMPRYRVLGLLDYAHTMARHNMDEDE